MVEEVVEREVAAPAVKSDILHNITQVNRCRRELLFWPSVAVLVVCASGCYQCSGCVENDGLWLLLNGLEMKSNKM